VNRARPLPLGTDAAAEGAIKRRIGSVVIISISFGLFSCFLRGAKSPLLALSDWSAELRILQNEQRRQAEAQRREGNGISYLQASTE
jgi:hypothetical protein